MKAIILTDMPDCCGRCYFCETMYDDEHEEWYEWCCASKHKIADTDKKENDCSLRPLPEKKDVVYSKNAMPPYSDGDYAEGWNACLDEITGCDKVANKL